MLFWVGLVSIDEEVKDSGMILILAVHIKFQKIDYKELTNTMRTSIIFDATNTINIKHYNFNKIQITNLGNMFIHNLR